MNTPYLTANLPARHGFFTRKGGVSTFAYASLNCSFSSADAAENISANRSRAAMTLGVFSGNMLGCKQVHGTTVLTVAKPWAPGTGPEADAMVTAAPNLALSIITADCMPVLFSDDEGRVVGAAHAGWRGAVAGVLEATVSAMRAIGAGAITAAIGPCIHQESYEVRGDLRDAVLAKDEAAARFFIDGATPETWQFDLPGYGAARLREIGVDTTILPHDTCTDEENFFSHRRRTLRGETKIGHQISIILIHRPYSPVRL